MKRVLIFLFLGPPLGLLTGMVVSIPALNFVAGGPQTFDAVALIVLMPLAYAMGAIPALLVCAIDAFLARFKVHARVALCALVGFFIGFLPFPRGLIVLASSIFEGRPSLGLLGVVALEGLVGAIPAAVCSWLAGPLRSSAVSR
jgi:hypothetical protein